MLKNSLKFILFLKLLTNFNVIYSQNCSVKIIDESQYFSEGFEVDLKVFFSLKFRINNVELSAINKDSIFIKPNLEGFDTISYSYEYDGNNFEDVFLCKLRPNEKYNISMCTCCGLFLMTPESEAERGGVKYINNSNKEFLAFTSEFDYDTLLRKDSTDYIPSLISVNCNFRPNTIFISDPKYYNSKFDYSNLNKKSTQEKELLIKQQNNYILYSFNYLFLHKEKLNVTIDKSGKKFSLSLVE
jgi:hypothetical protein